MSDQLFSSFSIKNKVLPNRIGLAPMTRTSSPGKSIPRQDVLDFLVRRAENGVALITTEAIVTDYESAQGYPRQSRLTTQEQIDTWGEVNEKIHRHGAVSLAQIFHCGRMAWPEVNPAERSIAPSALAPKQNNPLTGKPYPLPSVMSDFDIAHVIHGFVETAKGAYAAGFDGVEIHGAHGYLISQFLSAYSNQRTDQYGGSVENRFLFAEQIIQAIHAITPEDRFLTFRISDWGIADMEVSLFETAENWQQTIRLLSAQPIDAISVSTYDFSQPAFATDKTLAALTRAVTTLPIFICGKIYDRATADAALADADVILSAKSLLLNQNWVDDLKNHRPLAAFASSDANIAYTETPLL